MKTPTGDALKLLQHATQEDRSALVYTHQHTHVGVCVGSVNTLDTCTMPQTEHS